MTNDSTGWAITRGGTILINTVSATPRAAMVNYLVAYVGRMVFQHDTDEEIAANYERNVRQGDRLGEVVVRSVWPERAVR